MSCYLMHVAMVTIGYVAIITIHLCYMYVVVAMVTKYNCVFTFHLQISQSNLIQHHTLLMKLMVLFRSRLLLTGQHPQQTMVLHCSTQWMTRLLVRDTLVDTITNSTSALILFLMQQQCNWVALGLT